MIHHDTRLLSVEKLGSHSRRCKNAKDGQDYVHRIGRTGRAGRKGKAITLLRKGGNLKLEDEGRSQDITR